MSGAAVTHGFSVLRGRRWCLGEREIMDRFLAAFVFLQAADEEFALVDHLRGQVVVEVDEELFVADDFVLPAGAVDLLELVEVA